MSWYFKLNFVEDGFGMEFPVSQTPPAKPEAWKTMDRSKRL
jgi:hypothetical protein